MKRGVMIYPGLDYNRLVGIVDDLVNNWGANIFRWQIVWPPVGHDEYIQFCRVNAEMIAQIDAYIQLRGYKIKIVVDLHHTPGDVVPALNRFLKQNAIFADEAYKATFLRAWTEIVITCNNCESVWGYDLLNEPLCTYKKLRAMYHDLIFVLDSHNLADKPYILQPPAGNPEYIKALKPFGGWSNIIVSAHMYHPHSRTHQVTSSAEPAGTKKYPSRRYDSKDLENHLAKLERFEFEYKNRVFIGEFGFTQYSPKGSQAAWVKDVLNYFEFVGWDYCYHALYEAECWQPRKKTTKLLKKFFAGRG